MPFIMFPIVKKCVSNVQDWKIRVYAYTHTCLYICILHIHYIFYIYIHTQYHPGSYIYIYAHDIYVSLYIMYAYIYASLIQYYFTAEKWSSSVGSEIEISPSHIIKCKEQAASHRTTFYHLCGNQKVQ